MAFLAKRRSLRLLRNPLALPLITSEKKASKSDSVVIFENRVVSVSVSEQGKKDNVTACSLGVAREREAKEDKQVMVEEDFGSRRGKRKLGEPEESHGAVQEWSEDQELALQRAYLSAKPTPRFWKKVSRLVPGKSAQECFDKLNSDYATPPRRRRVPMENRKHLSPVSHLQLSPTKLLKPGEPKLKRWSSNRQNRRVTQKNARRLLQNHYHQNQVHEADLFSVLEPDLDFSTPKQLKNKQELHPELDERSSSGHKKGLRDEVLASPPVLKMVKNRVLHEKYIDQLHSRDARRKTTRENASKGSLKAYDKKRNVVVAAKNALVSGARDAITMLQRVRNDDRSKSSDSENDIFKGTDEESELEM